MEEQNKVNESVSEEIKEEVREEELKSVSKLPKITPKLIAIAGAALLVVVVIIIAILVGGKGKNNNSGGTNNNSANSGDNGSSGSGNENEAGGGSSNSGADDNLVNGGAGGDSVDDGTGDDSSNSGTAGGETPGDTELDTISIADFYSEYSEGYAFVKTAEYSKDIHCIDKSGNIVFTVESGVSSGFHNGWAMLEKYDNDQRKDIYLLCDKNGNTKTAEELGGDAIAFDLDSFKHAFKDGYIFVHKTTTNYQGSIDELAVFNSKLEKIVDFSKEIYSKLYNNLGYRYKYFNGYLFSRTEHYDYSNDCIYYEYDYIDVKTGAIGIGGDDFLDNISLKRKSDLWVFNDDYCYDYRDAEETPIINLEDNVYVATTNNLGYRSFVDGYAGLVFRVSDSQVGERNYFTIMDEDGDYCFEPIETGGIVKQMKSENGIFVLYSITKSAEKGYLEVYDKTGRIASMEFETRLYHSMYLYYADSVIYAKYQPLSSSDVAQTWIGVYNTKLESLFEVKPVV